MEKFVKIMRIIGIAAFLLSLCGIIFFNIRDKKRLKDGEKPLHTSEFTVQSVEKVRNMGAKGGYNMVDPYDYKCTGVLSSGLIYSLTVDEKYELRIGRTYTVYSSNMKVWGLDEKYGLTHSDKDKHWAKAMLWCLVGGGLLLGITGILEKRFC